MKVKRFLSMLLCAALVLMLAPMTAGADGTYEGLTVSGGTAVEDYVYKDTDTLTIQSGRPLTLSGTSTTRIVVLPGVDADITLDGVNIQLSSGCAFDMTGATVSLTLVGENTLASGELYAGLLCPEGAELTIEVDGEQVTLVDNSGNRVNVVSTDVDASNGVIHVLDAVLLPTL